jgi:hypothetical protein
MPTEKSTSSLGELSFKRPSYVEPVEKPDNLHIITATEIFMTGMAFPGSMLSLATIIPY